MSKSQETYNKKEREKKRLKKQQEKQLKREERRANPKESGLDSMMVYVDENGHLTDTPPDVNRKKASIKTENIEINIPRREKEEEQKVKEGIIDFFNTEKGFGFIREIGQNMKHFFHVNGLIDDVTENDKVSFELEPGLKGMNAVRVKKVLPKPAPEPNADADQPEEEENQDTAEE